MADNPLVLVDTSVWIRFFRDGNSPEGEALDTLLSVAAAATCAPIRAEVLSGAPSQREFQRLRHLFDALVALEPPQHVWQRIEEHRFALLRRGHRVSLVDLWIALTAQAHGSSLWTLDEDFRRISAIVPIRWYQLLTLPS